MKTAALIFAMAAIFVLPESSFALKHGDAGDRETENLQLDTTPDLTTLASELEEMKRLEVLLQKLKDPDPFVRVEGVQGLGEIQREKSLLSVCDCLDDENLYVRAYAAEAMGKIGQVDISLTLAKLLPAMDDPSPYVRAMMLVALGELHDIRAADAIRKLLHDEDESVRTMAAWALGKIENSQ